MSELLPLDLGGLKQPAVAVPQSVVERPAPANHRPNWLLIAMAAVIAFLLFLQFGRGPSPTPDPTPDVDIAGRYMLLLVDESKPDQVSKDQAPVLNSVKIADWCDEHDVKYRRLDERSDDSLIEDVWKQMKKVASDPPSMTTLADGKVKTQPVPDGIDATLAELEKVFK